MNELETQLPNLTLARPDIKRDAPVSLTWLEGEVGRKTLSLMGGTNADSTPPTLEAEQQRIKDFLDSTNQLTWMVRYEENTVGAVWVDLKATDYLPCPAIHIMIGDPAVRGLGIGENTIKTVIDYLQKEGRHDTLYSRHLAHNTPAAALLEKVGFEKYDEPYPDKDALEWQNVQLPLAPTTSSTD